MITEDYAIDTIRDTLSEEDMHDSTAQSFREFAKLLTNVRTESVDVIVALGSGIGGLTKALGEIYDASSIHAVDIDEEALSVAKSRGIEVHKLDVSSDPLPFETGSVDLIISLGLLEHLTWFDNVISESRRVLISGGYAVFALPNLAGWTNRLSILSGKQPRNVEFSQKRAFGIAKFYKTNNCVGHVHTATIPAFRQFLTHYEMKHIDTVGLHPYQSSRYIKMIDKIASYRLNLCRRFAMLVRLRDDQ